MPAVTLLIFAGALFVAALTPGPGMSAVVARALGGGLRGALPMVAGLVIGDFVYISLAIFGLAALAQQFALTFTLIRYAGAIYLVYLAYRMWTSRPDPAEMAARASERPLRTVLAGLTLTLGNPKTIVFYMALLPTLVPLETITLAGYFELAALGALIVGGVGIGYAVAAAGARRLFRSPKALSRLNRTAGAVMVGAAAAVVSR